MNEYMRKCKKKKKKGKKTRKKMGEKGSRQLHKDKKPSKNR